MTKFTFTPKQTAAIAGVAFLFAKIGVPFIPFI